MARDGSDPFPVLRMRRLEIGMPTSVPWRKVSPHAQRAIDNHSQTLERLAERGGLSPGELWCLVNNRKLWDAPESSDAERWLVEWLAV